MGNSKVVQGNIACQRSWDALLHGFSKPDTDTISASIAAVTIQSIFWLVAAMAGRRIERERGGKKGVQICLTAAMAGSRRRRKDISAVVHKKKRN